MKRYIYLKIIPKHIATIVLIISILERTADGKGRARLSYSVAETVCKSNAAFSKLSQIQPPSKTPIVNDKLCKTLTWSNCEPRGEATAACQKFKLKDCPAQSQSQSQSQPQRSKERTIPRIINGTDAKPHEFPHIVKILRNHNGHCGGTILNENYIITAAHCFYPFWGNGINITFTIIAGGHNIKVNEGTEQMRTVVNAIWHENYNPKFNYSNDIAVLLLDEPLDLSENVLPPDMPQPDYELAQGELVTVAGWGALTRPVFAMPQDYPDILQKVDLAVGLCGPDYPQAVNNTISICAVSDGGGQSPCYGDSGGPLTKKLDNGRYLFLGIVSTGIFCGDIFPNVHTKVSRYVGWINSHTEDC